MSASEEAVLPRRPSAREEAAPGAAPASAGTKAELDVAQYIPRYPQLGSARFSYEIARKKEFEFLGPEPEQPAAGRPALLAHQRFVGRYLSVHTPYEGLLVYFETGTGKTPTAIAVAEAFRAQNPGAGRALVLLKNRTLVHTFRRELSKVYPRRGYIPQLTPEEAEEAAQRPAAALAAELADRSKKWLYVCPVCGATEPAKPGAPPPECGCGDAPALMPEPTYERRLRDLVGKHYELVTYGPFVRRFHAQPAEFFRARFSDRVIVADEVHVIRNKPPSGGGRDFWAQLVAGEKAAGEKKPAAAALSVRVAYKTLSLLFHNAAGGKKLLLTATPMWDEAYEIAPLMNLILPAKLRLPAKQSTFDQFFEKTAEFPELTPEGVAKLSEAFRGRVAYMRSAPGGVVRVDRTNAAADWTPPADLKLYPLYASRMSAFQYAVSEKAKEEVRPVRLPGGRTREVRGGYVQREAREAAMFVFPDRSYGIGATRPPTAFAAYVARKGKQLRAKKAKPRYELARSLVQALETDGLRKYSAVFAAVVDAIAARPDQLVYVFTDAVRGGGAILLGKLLETLKGYKNVTTFPQPPDARVRRVAVVAADPATVGQAEIPKLIETFNAPDNAQGDRLQVIISGEMLALGVTLKNVQQVHLMAYWNFALLDQAVGRTLRIGAHRALADQLVQQAVHPGSHDALRRRRGMGPPPSGGGPIVVNVYTHIAVPPKGAQAETIGMRMAAVALRKDYKQSQVRRLIKITSVDCPLNYARNVFPSDGDGSRACDYQECNYLCEGYPELYVSRDARGVWRYARPDNVDASTYNLFYAAKAVEELGDQLAARFREKSAYHFDELADLFPGQPPTLLLYALGEAIDSRRPFRDRYGFRVYLREEGNVYFLDSRLGGPPSYVASAYTAMPLVAERVPLAELVEAGTLEHDFDLVKRFCAADAKDEAALGLFDQLAYRTQILLLESAYALSRARKRGPAIERVLERLRDRVFDVPGGGAAHVLYSSEYTGLSYGVTAQQLAPSGETRIYDPQDGRWHTVATPEEEERYLAAVRAALRRRKADYDLDAVGFVGLVSKLDNKFRILQKAAAGRGKRRGRACMNLDDDTLRGLFVQAGVWPPVDAHTAAIHADFTREEIASVVFETRNQHPAVFPGGWFSPAGAPRDSVTKRQLLRYLTFIGMDKKALCNELRGFLAAKNLLYAA